MPTMATSPPLSRARPLVTLVIRKYLAGLNWTLREVIWSLLPVFRRSGLSVVNVQEVPVKLSPEYPITWWPGLRRREERVRVPSPAAVRSAAV